MSGRLSDAGATAVLVSGGLDSAILVTELVRKAFIVQPLFIKQGYYWESVELAHLERFLDAFGSPDIRPLTVLDVPLNDLLSGHWAMTGRGVPGAETPDEAVFLPGRNLLLLTKAMLWCHLHGVPSVALGILKSNPFSDASPRFFATLEEAFECALGARITILRPFETRSKREVLPLGRTLPLGLTFSCIQPVDGLHCGACNKCGERKKAFEEASINDPTLYVSPTPMGVSRSVDRT